MVFDRWIDLITISTALKSSLCRSAPKGPIWFHTWWHVKSGVPFRARAASCSTLQAHIFRSFQFFLKVQKKTLLVLHCRQWEVWDEGNSPTQMEEGTEYRRGSTKSHTFGTDLRANKFCLQPDSLMSPKIAKMFASTWGHVCWEPKYQSLA